MAPSAIAKDLLITFNEYETEENIKDILTWTKERKENIKREEATTRVVRELRNEEEDVVMTQEETVENMTKTVANWVGTLKKWAGMAMFQISAEQWGQEGGMKKLREYITREWDIKLIKDWKWLGKRQHPPPPKSLNGHSCGQS